MNYLRILKLTLPVWLVLSAGVYFWFGRDPFLAQTSGFLACLFGALAGEFCQSWFTKQKTNLSGAAFLLGSIPRTVFPLIFLVFSLKFYHYSLDKNVQCAIIGSYFAYYPLILFASAQIAIKRAKDLEAKELAERSSAEMISNDDETAAENSTESSRKAD